MHTCMARVIYHVHPRSFEPAEGGVATEQNCNEKARRANEGRVRQASQLVLVLPVVIRERRVDRTDVNES